MADTALATFDAAITRAKNLLNLYHGLVNVRQRGIRADWSEKFCRLMHWPLATNIERVDGRDAIIVLRDGAQLTSNDFDESELKDTLRASLVMAVSAVDAYYHSKVLAHIVKAANKGGNMPASLMGKGISIKEFVAGKRYTNKMQIVRNAMNLQLGFQSLQQPSKIADALQLIGITGFWNSVAGRMGSTQEDAKKELSAIVKRRNQIAHEGDLSQSKKARNKPNDLTHGTTVLAINFVDSLARASELEINYQLGI